MPFILKEEVVTAYSRLHNLGVIHGSPQLRNMLICADGRVKLVDFQASRALNALLTAGIMPATRADIDLEMRQVKFKLDYVGARQYEFDKRDRAHDIETRNKERARLRKLQYRGRYDGDIDEDEHYTGDDALNPPIPDPFWQDHWIDDIDRAPRRFVAPGQTDEDLRNALLDFENVIIAKTKDYDERMLARLAGGQSSKPVTPPEDGQDGAELESVVIGGYSIRRRKRSDSEVSDVGGPTKTRESAEEELQRLVREANAEAAAATEYPFPSRTFAKTCSGRTIADDEYGYDLPRASSTFSRSKEPVVHDYRAVVPPSEPLASNPYSKSSSSKAAIVKGGDLPQASSSAGVASKEVKIIDYATQPYYGPRGYYVPHPPTETRAGIERVRHIRETNRETAEQMGFGPSYAREDPYCIPPSYKRPPSDRPWFTTISLGKLKRRREVLMGHEDHGDYPHVPKRRKAEGEQEGAGEYERIEPDEHIQLYRREPAYPPDSSRGSSSSGRATRKSKRPVRDPATGKLVPVPILKPARPREFRKLPARREFWTGEREPCLSPKLGPPRLPVGRDEPRAILGAFVYPALPYFHMRRLTSEQRRVDKVLQGGSADSTPPPPEALVSPAEDGPVPEARDQAGNVASGSATRAGRPQQPDWEELRDDAGGPLEPADDSAPYWPPGQGAQPAAPVQPAPPANHVREHRPSRRAEVATLDPEARKEYIGRALGMIAIGCAPPPLPVTPRRRRHEGSHYPPILPHVAVPPQRQVAARSVAPQPLPQSSQSSSPTREQRAQGPSRPSSSRRRQATPGPSRSVASGPAVVRGRSNVPTYGQGATFNSPRLPGSSPDQHRAKRRRTDGYLSSHATHGSPTPPPAPALVKQESDDRMVIDVDLDEPEVERKPCVQVPASSKSYWQSFVGWFTRTG